MDVFEAQRDVREVYVGGFFGQLVSGIIWLVAAAVATGVSPSAGAIALFAGGVLIFPLTTLLLRITGRAVGLPKGHPMVSLAMQIAFTVPLGLLVALAVSIDRPEWFFPAAMIVVGAHYLPFVFLYGMPAFATLAGILAVGGVALALWIPGPPSLGGWLTGIALVGFAFVLRAQAAR